MTKNCKNSNSKASSRIIRNNGGVVSSGTKAAFTLAEVLITLAIVGIVAALTLPSLITKYQHKQLEIGFKKIYSELAQATQSIVFDSGGSLEGVFNETDNPPISVYQKYMKNVQICTNFTNMRNPCWPEEWFLLSGQKINSTERYHTLITPSGTSMIFYLYSTNCDNTLETKKPIACARIRTDINGYKRPNTVGRDIFDFYITKDKIIPRGAPETTSTPTNAEGWGKAYYVLQHGMDY